MRSLPRYIPALVLIALYGLIVFSPLAPLAMRSATIAHALTGECASDCSICGCSPERSANHTCCCWQKSLQHDHDEDQDEPDCCKKNRAGNKSAKISSRPCNGTKTMALEGVDQNDVIPYHFSHGALDFFETPLIVPYPICRAGWTSEPPDPPPKHFPLS